MPPFRSMADHSSAISSETLQAVVIAQRNHQSVAIAFCSLDQVSNLRRGEILVVGATIVRVSLAAYFLHFCCFAGGDET